MIEGQSGLLSVCSDWDRPNYEPSKRRVTFKNGAVCTAYSAEEADRLEARNMTLRGRTSWPHGRISETRGINCNSVYGSAKRRI